MFRALKILGGLILVFAIVGVGVKIITLGIKKPPDPREEALLDVVDAIEKAVGGSNYKVIRSELLAAKDNFAMGYAELGYQNKLGAMLTGTFCGIVEGVNNEMHEYKINKQEAVRPCTPPIPEDQMTEMMRLNGWPGTQ